MSTVVLGGQLHLVAFWKWTGLRRTFAPLIYECLWRNPRPFFFGGAVVGGFRLDGQSCQDDVQKREENSCCPIYSPLHFAIVSSTEPTCFRRRSLSRQAVLGGLDANSVSAFRQSDRGRPQN